MFDTILVSLAITAGVIALAGVPLRCWQFATGRFRSRIPQNALARATFRLFAFIMLVPNALAWTYALYVIFRDYTGAGARVGVASAVAVGLLGCTYLLLESFLFTARRRSDTVTSDRHQDRESGRA